MTASERSLRDALGDYLALRRALGFRLAAPARLLGQFVGYLEARSASTITTADALAWAVLPAGASPAWHAIRLSAVRGLAAYLHGSDPSVQVPPAGLIAAGTTARPPTFTPMLRSARSSPRQQDCGPGSGRPPTRP